MTFKINPCGAILRTRCPGEMCSCVVIRLTGRISSAFINFFYLSRVASFNSIGDDGGDADAAGHPPSLNGSHRNNGSHPRTSAHVPGCFWILSDEAGGSFNTGCEESCVRLKTRLRGETFISGGVTDLHSTGSQPSKKPRSHPVFLCFLVF